MELLKITKASKQTRELKKIFLEAFPRNERPPYFCLQVKAKRKNTDYFALIENGRTVGFTYSIIGEKAVYFFYFAIKNEERGKGYGTKALKLILEKYKDKSIFLAMEQLDEKADNFNQRMKRYEFYKNCGLKLLPLEIEEVSVTYDVMGTGEVKPQDYERLMTEFMGRFLKRFVTMEMRGKDN